MSNESTVPQTTPAHQSALLNVQRLEAEVATVSDQLARERSAHESTGDELLRIRQNIFKLYEGADNTELTRPYRDEIERLKTEVKRCCDSERELTESVLAGTRQRRELESKVEAANAKNSKLVDRVENLRTSLRLRDMDNKEIRDKLDRMKEHNASLHRGYETARDERELAESNLTASRQQVAELSDRVRELEQIKNWSEGHPKPTPEELAASVVKNLGVGTTGLEDGVVIDSHVDSRGEINLRPELAEALRRALELAETDVQRRKAEALKTAERCDDDAWSIADLIGRVK